MRFLLILIAIVWWSGDAISESIEGFFVGEEYECAVERATYHGVNTGESGVWSNAPEYVRLEIIRCKDATLGACAGEPHDRQYQLKYTNPELTDYQNSRIEGYRGSFAMRGVLIELKDGKIYYNGSWPMRGEANAFGAFTYVGRCYAAG